MEISDDRPSVLDHLRRQGLSRRDFLNWCAYTASILALPPSATPAIAQALSSKPRPSVIWLSIQECTGCSESILRSFEPTLESLIFDQFSLDYHHVLQAAAGLAAEQARDNAIERARGKYVLIVDGGIPLDEVGRYSTTGGKSGRELVRTAARGAALIIAVGTCATYGGIPAAAPNPTGAGGAFDALRDLIEKTEVMAPLINVPGCPPVPEVMTGVVVHFLTFGKPPPLDELRRPVPFFGRTVHDDCPRLPFFNQGLFAKSFDDEGARKGYCLKDLGCKGPTTFNACTTVKWNQRTSFPMYSGHGCLGCAQPKFWDREGGFYGKPF
ncbi:MAG: hydrogenase small subunit [Bradyrhizobium sp.]|jgi:hydrogenase small subunit|uniref:hydrogenase small subunit n=1 Tax=Bradyrhizobium sp. TaxID=376 RepID=UPI001A1B9A7E|nr:hydrogenase small subunit [Bradyrhizobium sp.]MBJ7402149.1 hydrogenase small subunit [Bradyrhizobium sp.]